MIKNGALGQYAAVFKTYHSHKEANAGCKGIFQWCGHHIEYHLSEVAHADDYKKQSLDKHGCDGKLPGVAQCQAYGFYEKGVERETRGQTEGALGDKRHEQCAYDGRERRGGKQSVNRKSVVGQWRIHHRHECQDIYHGEKCGDARNDFGFQTVALLREAQQCK